MDIPRQRAGAHEGSRIGIPHAAAHNARVDNFHLMKDTLPCALTTPAGVEVRIVSLGEIDASRPNFHAFKFIWPIGYRSQCSYVSLSQARTSPGALAWYESAIEDGGERASFTIRELAPDGSYLPADGTPLVAAATASQAWQDLDKRLREAGLHLPPKPVNGPDVFGFGLPDVMRAIEGAPGADKCVKYYFLEQREKGAQFPVDGPALPPQPAPPVKAPPAVKPSPVKAAPAAVPVAQRNAAAEMPPAMREAVMQSLRQQETMMAQPFTADQVNAALSAAAAAAAAAAPPPAVSGRRVPKPKMSVDFIVDEDVPAAGRKRQRGSDDEDDDDAAPRGRRGGRGGRRGRGGRGGGRASRGDDDYDVDEEDEEADMPQRGRASARVASAAAATASVAASTQYVDPYEVPPSRIRPQPGAIAPSRPPPAALGDAAMHGGSVDMLRLQYVPTASFKSFVDDETAPFIRSRDVKQLAAALLRRRGIPPRLRRAMVLEHLIWTARMERVDESRLRPLNGATRPAVTPAAAWSSLPASDIPIVLQAWHFLSGAAVPLGLDHIADAVQGSAGLSPALPPPWLDLHTLTSALAWSGRAQDDAHGVHHRTLTTLFASLTRYALSNLHAVLGVEGSSAASRAMVAAVRASVNSRLDGDTWPEFARQLIVAVAQQRTAAAAWAKCGQFIEEDAAENVIIMDDEDEAAALKRIAVVREDVSWVHTQRGLQVLAWFAPTAAREVHQSASGVMDAGYHGLGFGGATQSRTDVLWRPFDAYAYAQMSRTGDSNKRTFPALHPVAEPAPAAPQRDGVAVLEASTLLAASMAQLAPPPVGAPAELAAVMAATAAATCPAPATSSVTIPGGLHPASIGRGACVVAPNEAMSDDDEKEANGKGAGAGINTDWRSLILSLRGVATHDGSKHHAYIYGTVVEIVRS